VLSKFTLIGSLPLLILIAMGAGCGESEVPVAQESAASVDPVAVSADPKAKEFLAAVEKLPMAARPAYVRSNPAMAQQIMNGSDPNARVQMMKLLGH